MPRRLFSSLSIRVGRLAPLVVACVAFAPWGGTVPPAAPAAWAAQPAKSAQPNYDAERKDGEYGFRQEGMDFGRDPKTGDIYYQIDPPRPDPTQSGQATPIIVYPEVDMGGRPHRGGGSGSYYSPDGRPVPAVPAGRPGYPPLDRPAFGYPDRPVHPPADRPGRPIPPVGGR